MSYEEVIDEYNDLREKCYELARMNDGELMGSSSWLRGVILESEINLDYSQEGIHCHGHTYTSQTMDHEYFDFIIPLSELEK